MFITIIHYLITCHHRLRKQYTNISCYHHHQKIIYSHLMLLRLKSKLMYTLLKIDSLPLHLRYLCVWNYCVVLDIMHCDTYYTTLITHIRCSPKWIKWSLWAYTRCFAIITVVLAQPVSFPRWHPVTNITSFWGFKTLTT